MKSTADRVKARFEAEGLTIAEWAKVRGYNPRTVYAVIQGHVKGKRGLGHRIAVDLGIKPKPQDEFRTNAYVSTAQIASALNISRSCVRKVVVRENWHGFPLDTRQRHGRGGNSGAHYEVRLSSLPLHFRDRVRALVNEAASLLSRGIDP